MMRLFGLLKPNPTPYEVGFNAVMRRHKEGLPMWAILMAVVRLTDKGDWPEQVEGSWAAIAQLSGGTDGPHRA